MNLIQRCLAYVMLLALLAACAGAPVTVPNSAANDQPISKLFDAYIEEWLPLNPLSATRMGDHRYDDRYLDTISETHRAKLRSLYARYLAQARDVDVTRLSPPDRLSLDIFRWELTIRLALLDNDDYLRPVHQLDSAPSQFALLGSGKNVHPFKTVQDYDNFLRRIDGFRIWMASAISNMRIGIAKGATQPRVLMEKMLPQLQSMLVTDVKQSLFYQPIAKMPAEFSAEDKARLTAAYEKAITEEVIPAYRRLHDFIANEYLPACRTTAGIGALPDGSRQYARLIKFYTTTEMSADEIHALGLTFIRKAKAEMETIKREVGFDGDLKAFNQFVKTNKKFYPFASDAEILAAYGQISTTVQSNVPKLFGLKPRSEFEIRATEKFRAREASATVCGGQPGRFAARGVLCPHP